MRNLYSILVYAGAIPFAFCAALLVFSVQELPLLGPVEEVLTIYGLVIASFMAGVHWGQHLDIYGAWKRVLPILSNVIAIALWVGFLTLGLKGFIILLVAIFTVLLVVDHRLFQDDVISRHYFQTRFFISSIVILSLLVSWGHA
ncbi:MAG: DUF3429 domain-containing protein [Alphaproteobacteria bacterium]|nr:DUF3429 domain-containing protein [Alphaproteobacteria bacterium]